MSYLKGLNQGYREGSFGSGFFLGFVLPVVCTIIILGIAAIALWAKLDPGPGRCANYSYESGLLKPKTMMCDRWPAMEMSLEKRPFRATIVHCICTEASNPPAEK